MRVVVTGGAGFIGSHLAERLVQEGYPVVVIDNFTTGRKENLDELVGNQCLTVLKGDVQDPSDLRNAFAGASQVFHLAALADIVPSIEEPARYFETNVTGTMRVMELARECGVERVIYTASSSCYGIPELYPTPETAPIRPQYPYALTKFLGEQIVLHWGHVYKMKTSSVRLFNVFGPRHRTTGAYGAVFGTFLAQKLADRPLTIVGDGTQTRDFTYVTDVVEALLRVAESNTAGEVFNVGSGQSYSVNHLADLIGGERVHIPKRPGEPDRTFADITKIEKYLGWRPRIKFEEGVKTMLKNIHLWKNAPVWTPQTIQKATQKWFEYLS